MSPKFSSNDLLYSWTISLACCSGRDWGEMGRAGMRLIRLGIEDLNYAGVRCTGNESAPKCSCRTIVSVWHTLTHFALTALSQTIKETIQPCFCCTTVTVTRASICRRLGSLHLPIHEYGFPSWMTRNIVMTSFFFEIMLNLTHNLVLDAFRLNLLLARVDARETCSHLRYLLYASEVMLYKAFERLLFKPHGLGPRNIRCSGWWAGAPI